MGSDFYTYVYLDTRKPGHFVYGDYAFDHEPFYIGKGSGNRMYEHLRLVDRDPYNQHKVNRIKRILQDTGADPIIRKVKEWNDPSAALQHEVWLINVIGRYDLGCGPLLNATDGGDGVINPSDETREIFSSNMMGEKNPNWGGKAQTVNHVSHHNKKLVGDLNRFYGKTHSDETKKLLSAQRKNETVATKEKRHLAIKKARQEKSEQWCEEYIVTSPEGVEYQVTTGLNKFLKLKGLPYGTFLDMLKLKTVPTRGKCVGWKIVKKEA